MLTRLTIVSGLTTKINPMPKRSPSPQLQFQMNTKIAKLMILSCGKSRNFIFTPQFGDLFRALGFEPCNVKTHHVRRFDIISIVISIANEFR